MEQQRNNQGSRPDNEMLDIRCEPFLDALIANLMFLKYDEDPNRTDLFNHLDSHPDAKKGESAYIDAGDFFREYSKEAYDNVKSVFGDMYKPMGRNYDLIRLLVGPRIPNELVTYIFKKSMYETRLNGLDCTKIRKTYPNMSPESDAAYWMIRMKQSATYMTYGGLSERRSYSIPEQVKMAIIENMANSDENGKPWSGRFFLQNEEGTLISSKTGRPLNARIGLGAWSSVKPHIVLRVARRIYNFDKDLNVKVTNYRRRYLSTREGGFNCFSHYLYFQYQPALPNLDTETDIEKRMMRGENMFLNPRTERARFNQTRLIKTTAEAKEAEERARALKLKNDREELELRKLQLEIEEKERKRGGSSTTLP